MRNTFAGNAAGYNNTSGVENIAVGTNALYSNKTGADNTAIAFDALYINAGSYNTATGKLFRNSSK